MLSDFLRLIKGFILFIGPIEAGKTSILRRLVTGFFEEQEPTLGFREEIITKVRTVEIGGHPNYRKYWKVALDQKPVHVFFVIDITSENEFKDYQQFKKENEKEYPFIKHRATLIGNKADLITTLPEYLQNYKNFISSSAKNGDGMLDILEIIAQFKDKLKAKPSHTPTEKLGLNEKEKAEILLKKYKDKF